MLFAVALILLSLGNIGKSHCIIFLCLIFLLFLQILSKLTGVTKRSFHYMIHKYSAV